VSIPRSQRRAYNLAVVGGGITGLTSAWQASQNPKCTSVTIFEKEPRVGGWLQSEKVPVEGGHVLFEYGPRTLRSSFPGSMPLLNMVIAPLKVPHHSTKMLTLNLEIWSLGLFDEVITTSRKSPAAKNRFIYYPDRLVKIPTLDLSSPSASINSIMKTFQTLRSEPVFENVMSGFIFEPTKPPRPHSEWQKDESIASFIGRRFHPKMAENLVSAVMHGIYAGDIDQLSAQTILGSLRNMDADGILRGMLDCAIEKKMPLQMDDIIACHAVRGNYDGESEYFEWSQRHMRDVIRQSSTFTLKGGTQQLAEGLESALNKSDKVKIVTGTDIQSMTQQAGDDSIRVIIIVALTTLQV
jgi:oxygen-dependent protoporphyrinogen oxidase